MLLLLMALDAFDVYSSNLQMNHSGLMAPRPARDEKEFTLLTFGNQWDL